LEKELYFQLLFLYHEVHDLFTRGNSMRFFLCCATALVLLLESAAQPTTSTQQSLTTNDFSLFLDLTGHAFASPLRWSGNEWLRAGSIVAATGVVAQLDDDGLRLMERNQGSFANDLSDVISKYGSGITGLAVTGGFYCAGLSFDNTWLRETGILMASALSVSVVTESALKLAIGRARPYTGLGSGRFKPFYGKADFLSFPSGHTVVAFTLSAVLSERIKNMWASIGLYSMATMVAASRMYTRSHWFSDVLFAGTLSTFVARSIVQHFETENDSTAAVRLFPHEIHVGQVSIIPQPNIPGTSYGGVTVVWRL
jgi:hypothetical protein